MIAPSKKSLATTETVTLGCLGAPYGIQGWLHLTSYTDPIENLFNYNQLMVNHADKWKHYRFEQWKSHGKQFIVKIQGIDNRELAQQYTNDEIVVLRTALPELPTTEYYWRDLIGATVITQSGITLGTVTDLIATGANDVFIVSGERERLIPYTDDAVIAINLETHTIVVEWDPEF